MRHLSHTHKTKKKFMKKKLDSEGENIFSRFVLWLICCFFLLDQRGRALKKKTCALDLCWNFVIFFIFSFCCFFILLEKEYIKQKIN